MYPKNKIFTSPAYGSLISTKSFCNGDIGVSDKYRRRIVKAVISLKPSDDVTFGPSQDT